MRWNEEFNWLHVMTRARAVGRWPSNVRHECHQSVAIQTNTAHPPHPPLSTAATTPPSSHQKTTLRRTKPERIIQPPEEKKNRKPPTMPPKRRASGTPATSTRRNNQQPTLSFHGKNQNRVTKPVSRQHDAKKSIKDPAPFDLLPGDAAPELLKEPTTAEIAIEEQTRSATKIEPRDVALKAGDDALGGRVGESAKEKEKRVGGNGDEGEGEVEVEVRARKIGEAQIARYWRAKEQERKAPRVHQEGLTVGEKVLREWDMSGHYGVSCPFLSLCSSVYRCFDGS